MVVLTGARSKQLERLVNLGGLLPLAVQDQPAAITLPTRSRRLQPEEIVSILQQYQAGVSMAALAHVYGVRRDTISAVLRRSHAKVRQPRHLDTVGIDEAKRLYAQGWSLAKIGNKLGFDGETIRTHLTRHGVVMRSPNDRRS